MPALPQPEPRIGRPGGLAEPATSGLPARRATVPTKGSQITSVCDPFFVFLVSGLTPFAEDGRDNARVKQFGYPLPFLLSQWCLHGCD